MKILIVKLSAIGDVLQATACAYYLKQHYPKAEIHWAVQAPVIELLSILEPIKKTIPCHVKQWIKKPFGKMIRNELSRLRQENYDIVFDLQGNSKSALVTLLARGKKKVGFSWSQCPEKLNVFATNERYSVDLSKNMRQQYLELVARACHKEIKLPTIQQKSIQHVNARKKFLVAPFSKWKSKQLSQALLVELLNRLIQKIDCKLYFVYGTDQEKQEALQLVQHFDDRAVLLPSMSLNQLHGELKQMDGLIAMDSSLLHLADLANIRTFSFFGPSSAQKFRPLGDKHGHFQGSCPFKVLFNKRCPYLRTCKSAPCLHKPDETHLQETFLNWLSKEFLHESI